MGNLQCCCRIPNDSVAPMDNTQQSPRQITSNSVAPMDTQQSPHRIPDDSVAPMDNTQQSPRQITSNSVAPKDTQQSPHRIPNNTGALMDTQKVQQPLRRTPKIQFRVLILGRVNAGKTSILQRVCDTTESPVIYRGNEDVRSPTVLSASLISLPTRSNLIRHSMLVTIVYLFFHL